MATKLEHPILIQKVVKMINIYIYILMMRGDGNWAQNFHVFGYTQLLIKIFRTLLFLSSPVPVSFH